MTNSNIWASIIWAVKIDRKDILNLLIKAGALVNAFNNAGETPLIIATKNLNRDAIELLLNSGANLELTDKHNKTAVNYARESGKEDIIQLLVYRKAVVIGPQRKVESQQKDKCIIS